MDQNLVSALTLAISNLFPRTVEVCVAERSSYLTALYPAEEAIVAGAVPARQKEFGAGRACARSCLTKLGGRALVLLQDQDRVPIWPPGTVGSITHCPGFCAAAVARTVDVASLGIDAEVMASVSTDMRSLICSNEEVMAFPAVGTTDVDWYALAFSAKEAFYKCFFMLTRTYLDLLDARVSFHRADARSGSFSMRLRHGDPAGCKLAASISGQWRVKNEFILCGAFIRGQS